MDPTLGARFPVVNYDLAATLTSGQVFRWQRQAQGWEGVIGPHWVRLSANHHGIRVTLAEPVTGWGWLTDYLRINEDLDRVLATFPGDAPMRAATTACQGLRLVRQDPWECLASFILSSTKQIIQIHQIVAQLCQRFGTSLAVPPGHAPAFAFPTATRLADCTEAELRACKMGFRAPYLLNTARRVASGEINLPALADQSVDTARARLMSLPGVGRKIADCVLLFACGFAEVFPVDVWIMKALRQLYFPRRRPAPGALRRFADTHFGPHAGYAQQYLFHFMRTRHPEAWIP